MKALNQIALSLSLLIPCTLACSTVAFSSAAWGAQSYRCQSPNGDIAVTVTIDQGIHWSATYQGHPVLDNCPLSLQVGGKQLPGEAPTLLHAKTTTVRKTVRPTVPTVAAELKDHAQQLTLAFEQGVAIQFRAYDTGVAFRFITDLPGEIEIENELIELRFAADGKWKTYFPEEDSFQSHYERDYKHFDLASITREQKCSLPVLLENASHIFVAITDADLYDYPSTFLAGTGSNALRAVFPPAVLRAEPSPDGPDRDQRIVEEAKYIAKTSGERTLPWRVVMITDNMGRLLEDDLVFKLSRPLVLEDTSWIKPGKVAWDWWNALRLYDVDFEPGINTRTYKYYIDFASQYGLEYIILDEGWSKTTTNLLETKPEVDVQELVRYGKTKNVGVILWTLWNPLDQDMPKILDLWSSWGVRGIKVDFMQRADQQMVNFYEKTAREAAKRKLLVDFHGAFKPSGLRRAYPNVINYEGLRGLENCKWSDAITPEHDVTLPFVRMLAGPMDFTPGAMENAHKDQFKIRFERPMSLGTRCHQVAMYVVYESPLQMLCDTPSNYLKDPQCTSFIARMPTTWDETKVLLALPGQCIVIARRHAKKWYLAAMTNGQSRKITVPLFMLGDGTWKLDYIRDGAKARTVATDYELGTMAVSKSTQLSIPLAPGGGWAGIFEKQ